MFGLTQILVSTLVGGVASLLGLWVYRRWAGADAPTVGDTALLAVVVGVSILLWREAGNTAALNEDPIPVVSPNDVLCPVVTYVCLSVLAGFRAPIQGPDWPRVRALLTLVSLVVNVVTI